MLNAAYLTLFLSGLGAATLLPLQSESVLVGLIALQRFPIWALVAVATAGNVLGSMLNWLLGRYIERWRSKKWFPIKEAHLERAQRSYHGYGRWSLLLSWMPIIGDPLTVVAGVMREPLWSFTLIVLVAKAGRYVVLAALAQQMFM